MKTPFRAGLFGILFFSIAFSVFAQHVALNPVSRMGEGWWKGRHEANVAQMEKGDIDLLMIGDSITNGWNGNLWEMYYGNRKAINLGFSGDRTEHVLWRLDNLPLDKINPKAAVIMIGTNNIGHNSTNPKETSEGIKAIVDKLQKQYPDMKILLLNVFPRDEKPDGNMRKKVDEINSYLPEIFKGYKNLKLLDINGKFLEKDGTLSREIMPDSLHPREKGYGIWARAIEPYVSEMLGEKNPAVDASANKMGEGWWKDRHEGNVARVEKGDVGLLMIGDSITHGWDGQKEVWEKYYGEFNPINLGFGGDQTQHVLWRLDNLPLEKISPKGAVIMIGTNNTGNPRNTPYQIALGIKAVVEKLQKQYPEIKIIVLDVFPRDEKPDGRGRRKVNEINASLTGVLEGMKNVTILDINEKFLEEDGTLPKDIMPDALHPNAKGYQIWADAVDPTLKEMMK